MDEGREACEEARETGLEVCGDVYLSSPGQYSEKQHITLTLSLSLSLTTTTTLTY